MIVVLTGAPGAGKGTQADLLQEELGYRKFSTGDALRKHIKQGTEIGKKAAAVVASGKLVSDDILFEILKDELGCNKGDKILLDGYPRNLNQAQSLKKIATIHPVVAAVHLDVSKSELIERLAGRRVCSNCGKTFHLRFSPPEKPGVCDACGAGLNQRPDDMPDKIEVRLNVYEKETKPILDYFKELKLYKQIDGNRSQDEVFESLKNTIERLH